MASGEEWEVAGNRLTREGDRRRQRGREGSCEGACPLKGVARVFKTLLAGRVDAVE